MAKKPTKKKVVKKEVPIVDITDIVAIDETSCDCPDCIPIVPLTQEFGNGELTALRDKINEIIKRI